MESPQETTTEPAEGASLPPSTNGQVGTEPLFEAGGLPSAFFGYDRYSTEKHLASLAARYQALVQEQAARDQRIDELERELVRRQRDERLIGETLVAAHREAQMIKERARLEAQEALGTARKQATKMLQEAEAEAEAKTSEFIESAESERKRLLEEASRAKAFIEETHEQLSDFLLAAVKWYEQAKVSTGSGPQNHTEPASGEPS